MGRCFSVYGGVAGCALFSCGVGVYGHDGSLSMDNTPFAGLIGNSGVVPRTKVTDA